MRMPSIRESAPAEDMHPGVRCAVRFPVRLHVRVIANGTTICAESENFSANGILFRLDRRLQPGTEVEFLVEIPGRLIGAEEPAAIHCSGRVIRSFAEDGLFYAAAVIEEYGFQ
jgi:hypothetical protein